MSLLFTGFLETQIPDNEALVNYLELIFAWILTSLLILTITINLIFALVNLGASGFKYIKNKAWRKKRE